MSKNLSNVLKGTYTTVLPVSGNTGNVLTSTGSGWASLPAFSYTLPTANTTTLGGVKVDGTSITINANGVISGASTYTLPTANTTTLGGIKVDGTTITANNGVISSTAPPVKKTISNISAAYTVVAGDLGKIINCTSGTFTVSLTAAASLGAGFTCTIWNTSNTDTNAITIDPNAAETVDGLTTIILRRGEGLDIVCDGTNWQIDNKKPMRGYAENYDNTADRPVATGFGATALGHQTTASSMRSVAIGANANGSGSVATTGAGAMALGGSYASGMDSFAAAIGNNTSTYGATAQNNIALGASAIASGGYSTTAIGGYIIASGNASVAIGFYSQATGIKSCAIGGDSGIASGNYSVAIGTYARAAQIGKFAFGSPFGITAQAGKIVLAAATTTTTAVVLTSDGGAASTTNQLIVASGQAMAIQGTLIAKVSGTGAMAGWNITGIVSNNAGTMAVSGLALTAIGSDSITLGAQPTIAVDNTNKGVTITSGYKSATNIRWVATVNTSEVTYA